MMTFTTASGTKYEVDGLKVRRVPDPDAAQLRRDEEWLNLLNHPVVEVGQPATLVLEGLGDPPLTIRATTRVTEVTPGPLPEREDSYITDDPEPWERPWSGQRAPHTGVNLYGSGYRFNPRPDKARS